MKKPSKNESLTWLSNHNSKPLLILLIILIIGFILRFYKIFETLGFGHDADLFSWIVKDILVDHHIRLIGQETSTPGIFIGPLFYYLLTPFYLITNFHPASAIYLGLIISLATIISYYFVFKKLFDQTTGLIAAFLQAVISYRASYDRWIVPTITVNIWAIWYFFSIVKLSQGNFNYLWLAGLLTGLIWHIHIALAPVLILIPLSVFFAKKLPTLKQIGLFLISFILPMLPFFAFEARHNFSQTHSFFQSFFYEPINVYGDNKIDDVIRLSFSDNYVLNFGMLIVLVLLARLKVISNKVLILLLVWIGATVTFFTLTKKLISEYYFESFRTVILISIILFVGFLIKSKQKSLKIIGSIILIFILINSLNYFYKIPVSGNGYLARSKVVEYIKNDSVSKNYPCISVTHITRPGEDFGYRYLFWYNKIKMARESDKIPNYTIVFPFNLATESARFRYGAINVIPPQKEYNLEQVAKDCPAEDYNLTDTFWGFTK